MQNIFTTNLLVHKSKVFKVQGWEQKHKKVYQVTSPNVNFVTEVDFTLYNWIDKYTNTSLAAKGALANRLQCRTASKIQNGRRGPQNGGRGLERSLPLGFWAF